MTTKFIGIKEFRSNLSALSKAARRRDIRYVVMNKNKPVLDVRPITEQEATLESLAARVAEAREDVKAGRVYTLAEVKTRLGL